MTVPRALLDALADLDKRTGDCEWALAALTAERSAKLGTFEPRREPGRGSGSLAVLARRLARAREDSAQKKAEEHISGILGRTTLRESSKPSVEGVHADALGDLRRRLHERLAALASGLARARRGVEGWSGWVDRLEALLTK